MLKNCLWILLVQKHAQIPYFCVVSLILLIYPQNRASLKYQKQLNFAFQIISTGSKWLWKIQNPRIYFQKNYNHEEKKLRKNLRFEVFVEVFLILINKINIQSDIYWLCLRLDWLLCLMKMLNIAKKQTAKQISCQSDRFCDDINK